MVYLHVHTAQENIFKKTCIVMLELIFGGMLICTVLCY